MQQSAATEKNGKCSSRVFEAFVEMLHEKARYLTFWFSQYFAITRLQIGKDGRTAGLLFILISVLGIGTGSAKNCSSSNGHLRLAPALEILLSCKVLNNQA